MFNWLVPLNGIYRIGVWKEMAANIRGKEYNVRVIIDENGNLVIGAVQGFYHVSSNITDIKKVPDSTVKQIAKKLGIERSVKPLNAASEATLEETRCQDVVIKTFAV